MKKALRLSLFIMTMYSVCRSLVCKNLSFLDRDIEYTDTTLYKVVLQIIFLLHGMYCLDSVLIASHI